MRWLPIILFVVTVVSRVPFASQYLYHWDSVNMAFGLRQFDVMGEAPQFPGYIVYIALGQILDRFIGNPQTTMVVISIVSSGLAAVAIFYLGRDMFNLSTSLLAALFVITSPLVWFYSEIALPHTLDLFGVTLAAWLLYRIMQGDTRHLWLTAVFLALLGGFRQQNLIFLGPLILFAVWRIGIRRITLFAAVGAAVSLAWFLPLIYYTGGLKSYLAGSSAYSNRFFQSTSLLQGAGMVGLRRNLISKLIPYTLYAWSLALLPAVGYWGPQILRHWRAGLTHRKVWFFALWMAPTLAFYIVIHMGQQGLVFVFMPALFLLSAAGLYRLFETRPSLLYAATAVIALVGAGIFVLGPTYPLGENGPKLLTYSTLREHDSLLQSEIAAIRGNLGPQNTIVLAADWRFFQYYLPEYPLARISVGGKWEVNEGQLADTNLGPITADQLELPEDGHWQIALLTDGIAVEANDDQIKSIDMAQGGQLAYLSLSPDQALMIGDSSFRVVERQAG